MRPQGVALPILGVAARVTLDESRRRAIAATIAIGPAGPIPFRATESEAILLAADPLDAAAIASAVAAAQRQAELRTSKHRATKEYRHEMLLRRAACAFKCCYRRSAIEHCPFESGEGSDLTCLHFLGN